MANILQNLPLGGGFWLMEAELPRESAGFPRAPQMGQFYMLRAWETYPVLSRPISVFDAGENRVSFLYKVVGKGTALLSACAAGQNITLDGPYGTGWPEVRGRIALVGGGVGVAPFYLAAKALKALDSASQIDTFLGFSDAVLLEDAYRTVSDNLTAQVGGFITDAVEVAAYDHILACGPDAMMAALYKKCAAAAVQNRLWVSLENRMACGIGACLVCTCKTSGGNKKACTDGPVMKGEAVYGNV